MKQTRKQIFYIIIGVVAALLATILIVISLNTSQEVPEKTQEEQAQEQEEKLVEQILEGENGNEEAADIVVGEDDKEAPPEGIYENTYTGDEGYTKLTDPELAKKNPENTVYDENWAYSTWGRLACELSTKQTVSEKALSPILEFKEDLSKVDSMTAEGIIMNVDNLLVKLQRNLGDRMPPDGRSILLGVCDQYEMGPAQQ